MNLSILKEMLVCDPGDADSIRKVSLRRSVGEVSILAQMQ